MPPASRKILTRFLEWLRAIIRLNSQPVTIRPLYALLTKKRWENGELWEIQLDEQAWPYVVYAAIFVPFRNGRNEQDCWLICELIEARGKPDRQHTHYVSIFLATHLLKEIQPDLVAVLHEGSWDFQGRSPYRNQYVRCIMFRVASQLRIDDPFRLRWEMLIMLARQECWRGSLTGLVLPRSALDVIAKAYDDGTDDTRIIDSTKKRPE
jgi:hypothetical protein